ALAHNRQDFIDIEALRNLVAETSAEDKERFGELFNNLLKKFQQINDELAGYMQTPEKPVIENTPVESPTPDPVCECPVESKTTQYLYLWLGIAILLIIVLFVVVVLSMVKF